MPMREYVCTPRPRRCRAWWYIPVSVLITLILWFLPIAFDLRYPVVIFFFSLLSLTVALMILSRCVLCRYVYRLEATEDGGFDFVVDEVRRLRSVCVCRVETESIRAIDLIPKGRHLRSDFDWRVFGNTPVYLLTLTDGEETVTARVTPDATLVAMIADGLHPICFPSDGADRE